MGDVPTVNTSTWRLPKKGHSKPEVTFTDDMYRSKGLPVTPEPTPSTGGSGLPTVDTAEWVLPSTKAKALEERTRPETVGPSGHPLTLADVVGSPSRKAPFSRRGRMSIAGSRQFVKHIQKLTGKSLPSYEEIEKALVKAGLSRKVAGQYAMGAVGLIRGESVEPDDDDLDESGCGRKSFLKKKRPQQSRGPRRAPDDDAVGESATYSRYASPREVRGAMAQIAQASYAAPFEIEQSAGVRGQPMFKIYDSLGERFKLWGGKELTFKSRKEAEAFVKKADAHAKASPHGVHRGESTVDVQRRLSGLTETEDNPFGLGTPYRQMPGMEIPDYLQEASVYHNPYAQVKAPRGPSKKRVKGDKVKVGDKVEDGHLSKGVVTAVNPDGSVTFKVTYSTYYRSGQLVTRDVVRHAKAGSSNTWGPDPLADDVDREGQSSLEEEGKLVGKGGAKVGQIFGRYKVVKASPTRVTIASTSGVDPGPRFRGKEFTYVWDGAGYGRQGEYLHTDGVRRMSGGEAPDPKKTYPEGTIVQGGRYSVVIVGPPKKRGSYVSYPARKTNGRKVSDLDVRAGRANFDGDSLYNPVVRISESEVPSEQAALAGLTEQSALPHPLHDTRALQAPRAHGVLDDGQDSGEAFVDQVLAESRWFFRDFGDLALGVSSPFAEAPGGRAGPWRGADDKPAPTPIVRKGKIHGAVGQHKSPEEKGEVDVGKSEIDYDHEPGDDEEEAERKKKQKKQVPPKAKAAPDEEPEDDEEQDEWIEGLLGEEPTRLGAHLKGLGSRVKAHGRSTTHKGASAVKRSLKHHLRKFAKKHGIDVGRFHRAKEGEPEPTKKPAKAAGAGGGAAKKAKPKVKPKPLAPKPKKGPSRHGLAVKKSKAAKAKAAKAGTAPKVKKMKRRLREILDQGAPNILL